MNGEARLRSVREAHVATVPTHPLEPSHRLGSLHVHVATTHVTPVPRPPPLPHLAPGVPSVRHPQQVGHVSSAPTLVVYLVPLLGRDSCPHRVGPCVWTDSHPLHCFTDPYFWYGRRSGFRGTTASDDPRLSNPKVPRRTVEGAESVWSCLTSSRVREGSDRSSDPTGLHPTRYCTDVRGDWRLFLPVSKRCLGPVWCHGGSRGRCVVS